MLNDFSDIGALEDGAEEIELKEARALATCEGPEGVLIVRSLLPVFWGETDRSRSCICSTWNFTLLERDDPLIVRSRLPVF